MKRRKNKQKMNLENVKIGEYKNYKDLCTKLNMTIEEGNSKVRQINELGRYCRIEHDRKKWGNKYFITEIYDVEKTELGTGLYKQDIELLILDLLAQNGDKQHVSLTIKNLLRELEMVNDNYVKGYNNYIKLSELLKVEEETIEDIFYLIHNKTTRNLRSALSDLVDKALIILDISLYVCSKKSILDYNELGKVKLDDNGMPVVLLTYDDYREATDKEKEHILKVKKSVMNEMGVNSERFFNINGEARDKFRRRCKEKLKEYNIKFYYYQYDITYNSDNILEELGRIKRAEVRNRLNQNILSQIETTIENISNNTKGKIGDDAMDFLELELYSVEELRLTPKQQVRVKDSYVKDGKKTAKVVIDRKIKGRNKIKWDLHHENFNKEYLKAN